jgi:hypothetical protein
VLLFLVPFGFVFFLYPKDKSWFSERSNIKTFGFLYADFTFDARYYFGVVLLRNYCNALVLGVGRNAYVQISVLIAIQLASAFFAWEIEPFRTGMYPINELFNHCLLQKVTVIS